MTLRRILFACIVLSTVLSSGCGIWRNRPGVLFPNRDKDCDRAVTPSTFNDGLAYNTSPTGFTGSGRSGDCSCGTGGISTGPIISGPMGTGPYTGGGIIYPPGGTYPGSTTEPPKIPRIGVKEEGGGAKNTDPNEKESKRPATVNPYEVLPIPVSGPKLGPTK